MRLFVILAERLEPDGNRTCARCPLQCRIQHDVGGRVLDHRREGQSPTLNVGIRSRPEIRVAEEECLPASELFLGGRRQVAEPREAPFEPRFQLICGWYALKQEVSDVIGCRISQLWPHPPELIPYRCRSQSARVLCKVAADLREPPGLVIVDPKVGNDAVTSSPVKVPEDVEGKAADGGRGGEPAGPSVCEVGNGEPALRPSSRGGDRRRVGNVPPFAVPRGCTSATGRYVTQRFESVHCLHTGRATTRGPC